MLALQLNTLKNSVFAAFFLKTMPFSQQKKKEFLEILDILCTLVLENLGHA
jgi:hypothetical protein